MADIGVLAMMIGHFAVGFGAKYWAPKTSLGSLLFFSVFGSLLWATLVLFGLEEVTNTPEVEGVMRFDFHYFPISHSLLMVLIWAGLAGIAYYAVGRYRRGAWAIGAIVACHWLGDWIVHRPDLPIYPGGTFLAGLGIYSSVPATLAVEFALLAGGLVLYLRKTRPTDRAGVWGMWLLGTALVVSYIVLVFVPVPKSIPGRIAAQLTQIEWLLIVLGYWVDRHRSAVA